MESASTLPDCSDAVYTSCYCEENIYWLTKRFLGSPEVHQQWDVFAVTLRNQRAALSRNADSEVIWDYHVVLALRQRRETHCEFQGYCLGTWIYDLDTCLPIPCHWDAYVDQTFPLGAKTPIQYQSLFRVIPGEVYLNNFASDRSHMLQVFPTNTHEEPRYFSEPPLYAAICGPEAEKHRVRNNLMTHFVSMIGDGQGFGTVMDSDAFTTWCSLAGPRAPSRDSDSHFRAPSSDAKRPAKQKHQSCVNRLVMNSASSSSIVLNGHTPTNGSATSISHQSDPAYGDDANANVSAVSPVLVSNGYSHTPYQLHNEEIVNHLYHAGFQTGNYADTILHVHQNSYRLHAIILSRSPYLAHLMSTSPQTGGQRVIYVQLDHEPEVTHEYYDRLLSGLLDPLYIVVDCETDSSHLQGFAIALGYLYSSVSINLIRSENARGVLAAGCLLGGMEDLCGYAYAACRQSISVETITEWLEFIDGIPVSPDGSLTPQPSLTSVFGEYARRLREDVFNFLVVTLPNTLEIYSSAGSESGPSQGHSGRDTLLQIFSLVPFDMFKAAVESPTFQIGSDQCRFKFAKEAIELRKRGIARGQGSEETVVLAFGGGHMRGSAVHVTRKMRKRPLWKVNS